MPPSRRAPAAPHPARDARGPSRRTVLLAAVVAVAVVIAGLALPGVAGGALLLALALALAALTTAVHTRPDLARGLDPGNWVLRILVVLALTAVGLVKLFAR